MEVHKKKKERFPLHWRIISFLFLGILWGLYASGQPGLRSFTLDFIKPWGEIFIRLLKVVAIPIVLTSLITGIARLRDASRLARIGGKTILLFLITALIATTLGIILVTVARPGTSVSQATRSALLMDYNTKAQKTITTASELKKSPLAPLVDMVPENIFSSGADNRKMVQVVVFALLFGIALTKVEDTKAAAVTDFLEGTNEVLMKMVSIIIRFAPLGVFALISGTIVEISGEGALEILVSLLNYSLTVMAGLLILLFVIYPLIFTSFSDIGYKQFFREMRPAFLLGFSSSSSNATLPLTMERLEKHLHVPEEITGFVLPFGTTINMDGTALYQAVAAVFIAQVSGIDLSFFQMFAIVLTATVAAAGAAGIPGAGMITLVIVLETIHVPAAGIALIMAPDRILDMCRTVVNVAGDAVAAVVIAGTEKTSLASNTTRKDQ